MVQQPHLKCSSVHGTVVAVVDNTDRDGHCHCRRAYRTWWPGVYPHQEGMWLVAIAMWPGTKDYQHAVFTLWSVTGLDISFPSPLFPMPISFGQLECPGGNTTVRCVSLLSLTLGLCLPYPLQCFVTGLDNQHLSQGSQRHLVNE